VTGEVQIIVLLHHRKRKHNHHPLIHTAWFWLCINYFCVVCFCCVCCLLTDTGSVKHVCVCVCTSAYVCSRQRQYTQWQTSQQNNKQQLRPPVYLPGHCTTPLKLHILMKLATGALWISHNPAIQYKAYLIISEVE